MEQFSLVTDYTDSEDETEDDGPITSTSSNSVSQNQPGTQYSESKLQVDQSTNNFFSLDPDSDSSNNAEDDDKKSTEFLLNPFLPQSSSKTSTNSKELHHNPFNSRITETTSVGTESVFSIPIRESEKRESELLQHHVKMTSGFIKEDKSKKVNGKKLCWNHQAGKCRFGHKCSFVHDSDLLSLAKTYFSNPDNDKKDNKNCGLPSQSLEKFPTQGGIDETPGAEQIDCKKRKKNRGGLSDSIIPSKKALKQYYKDKGVESLQSQTRK